MKEKLPKVYANKITKEFNNNEKIYVSSENTNENKKIQTNNNKQKKKNNTSETSITKKINRIINTKNYIYKIPVIIKTKNKEIKTQIIGKNTKNIITINNELIKIDDIIDVEIYENKQ